MTRRCLIECINCLDTARQITLSDEIFRRFSQLKKLLNIPAELIVLIFKLRYLVANFSDSDNFIDTNATLHYLLIRFNEERKRVPYLVSYSIAENPISKNLDDKPFVKNIENVQGDERDIIIFSVGYARDTEG